MQLDVVVELPFLPSLPIVGNTSSRLYLAESVAAVIEVKSNIASQWDEALKTAEQLAQLQRQFGSSLSMGPPPGSRIPLFVVGYTGWAQMETVKEHLSNGPIDGILIIQTGIFINADTFGSIVGTGPWALWGLIA